MKIFVLISKFHLKMFYCSEWLPTADSSFLRRETCLLFLLAFSELAPGNMMVNICLGGGVWRTGSELNVGLILTFLPMSRQEKSRWEILQQEQRLIEEKNKRKKALLAKAIAERWGAVLPRGLRLRKGLLLISLLIHIVLFKSHSSLPSLFYVSVL